MVLLYFLFLVTPMQLLVNSLKQCNKSYKNRQDHVNESLDFLSFNYPDVYSLLFKEVKKRELESNNPYKIIQFSHNLSTISYVKLHGALILVKGHNNLAKEMYLIVLEHMLCQTIENRINIEQSMKICYLIETSKTLSIIYE